MIDPEYAQEVSNLSKFSDGRDENIDYTVGDPLSFWTKVPTDKGAVHGRPFKERWETFDEYGVHIVKGDNRRVPGWSQIHQYLKPQLIDGELVSQMHISKECRNLSRTLPALVRDDVNVEDVADGMEDHAPDALRLGCQSRSSDFVTKTQKYRDNWEAAEAQLDREEGKGVDVWR